MKGLGKYKLDKAFTEGVIIYLDDAPDVPIRVRLPSQYNRGYNQALYGGIKYDVDETGNVKPTSGLMDMKYAQEDAFLSDCLVDIDGEPVPENFREEYPVALAELMEKAKELADAIEFKVADSVKKSPASSDGSESGAGKKSSTLHLKSQAG